ncbi:universal stress protein [Salipaludibacillus aurantiacus]|uniref:Universal stress protein n=1 Tax=Salipaludibacillus aurantiacus TaxID=1601833 RepID=A0A1H9WJJ8_9BACI|nr:universal stress protein [Salipaludibacillus aurantiacus]SES34068.1 Nucleotide-binding universal stress protein, UspA family [Salipaludibacillus aurantiacus]
MLDENYKHVLLAYDGSVDAEKALFKAVNLARRNNAKLTVAYVVDVRSPHIFADKPGKIDELADEHGKEMKLKMKEKIEEYGFDNYHLRIEKGNPKTVITYDLIDEVGADIVICGSNGIDSYDQMIMGSTSENIVRYSSVDVLVIK